MSYFMPCLFNTFELLIKYSATTTTKKFLYIYPSFYVWVVIFRCIYYRNFPWCYNLILSSKLVVSQYGFLYTLFPLICTNLDCFVRRGLPTTTTTSFVFFTTDHWVTTSTKIKQHLKGITVNIEFWIQLLSVIIYFSWIIK